MTYKLREGDTAVFDNLRVMHGRLCFASLPNSKLSEFSFIDAREGFVVEKGQDGARSLKSYVIGTMMVMMVMMIMMIMMVIMSTIKNAAIFQAPLWFLLRLG